MPPREDDDVARASGAPNSRSVVLVGGFALAVLATLAVFLTDNPQYLRIAVVTVAWAFVLAAFAAGRRGTDRVAAAAREQELRRVYERELDREVAARREYELELENELRRETEDAMRYELDALRGDIAALSGLRDEIAQVSDLRGDIAALAGLRDEVARVSALRDDVASLTSLRPELGQLAELRAEMARLRSELTEQLSSEMLVERIVMRSQGTRLPAEAGRPDAAGRTLLSIANWTDATPPRELTGGWPAIRLDGPQETQQFQQLRADRPSPGAAPQAAGSAADSSWADRPWNDGPPSASAWTPSVPVTGSWSPPPTPPASPPIPPSPPVPPARGRDRWASPPSEFDVFGPPRPVAGAEERRSRHAADEPAEMPQTSVSPVALPPLSPAPAPWELLSARELLDAPPPPPPPPLPPATGAAPRPSVRPRPSPRPAGARSLPEVPPRRRRTSDAAADPGTAARPMAPGGSPSDQRPPAALSPATGPSTAWRPAEDGVDPPPGGRRRQRRYREDDEQDDVLARVLRGD